MIVVPQNIEYIETEGLNGIRSWVIRHKKGLLGALVAIISGAGIPLAIISLATDIVQANLKKDDAQAAQRLATDPNPTTSEQTILDSWISTKLTPYFVTLTKQLVEGLKTTDLKAKVTLINDVMVKMCYIRNYYMTKELAGLSVNAQESRLDLLDEIFAPINELIGKSLQPYSSQVKLATNTGPISDTNWRDLVKLLSGLAPNQVLTCKKYAIIQESLIKNNPITPIKTLPTTNNTSTDNTSKSNQIWYWGAGIVTIVLVALSLKKQSKE